MPFSVTCPGCGSRITAPDAAAGRTAHCPKCQTPVSLAQPPAPSAAPAGVLVVTYQPTETDPPPRPVVRRGSDEIDRPPRRLTHRREEPDDDEDDLDERIARRKAAGHGTSAFATMFGGSMGCLVAAGAVFLLGIGALWVRERLGQPKRNTGGGPGEPAPVEVARADPPRLQLDPPAVRRPDPPVPVKKSRPAEEPPALPPVIIVEAPRAPTVSDPRLVVPPAAGPKSPGGMAPDPRSPQPGRPAPVPPQPAAPPLTAARAAELASAAGELKAKTAKARLKAAETLMAAGAAAAGHARELCDALWDPDRAVALAAMDAVEKVRPDLYRPLSQLLLDARAENRVLAADRLAAMGEKARPTAGILAALVRRSAGDPGEPGTTAVDQAVYAALLAMRPDDPATTKVFKELAGPANPKPDHRYAALGLLAEWAGEDAGRRKEVLPLVRAGLDNDVTRVECVRLAGEYGPLAKDLLPALRRYKLSEDKGLRDTAATAVGKIAAAPKDKR